jgi:formylglycine-generating enzyme
MRLASLVAVLGAASLLAALAPGSVAAASGSRGAIEPWSVGAGPRERAATGGVRALRAPASRMILVPRSSFVMGSTAPDILDAVVLCARGGQRCREVLFADELPQRRVSLAAYWLDRTEVTVAAYQRCVELGRCRAVPYSEGAERFAHPSYPVSLVSHEDARAYCAFRGARLPTEAEWERAARGPNGRRFPWGNLYNSRAANHGRLGLVRTDDRDGYVELAPVGAFPQGRTPEGFLDLAGNVAEWVSDYYAPGYPDRPETNPKGPPPGSVGTSRVVRGGSYEDPAAWLRGAARREADPSTRRPSVGFRCAKNARQAERPEG